MITVMSGRQQLPRLAEEKEGLHGVFKQLRRNGHQLIKGSCKHLVSGNLHQQFAFGLHS
jgi:hypothetical protein